MKDFRRPTSEMETKMGCQECSCKSKSGDFLTPSGYEKENEKMLDEPVRFDSEFLKIVSILGEEIYTMKNSVDKIELLIGHIDSRYIKDDKNEKSARKVKQNSRSEVHFGNVVLRCFLSSLKQSNKIMHR